MNFTWQELIDRARVYCDDDHKGEARWIADDKWLTIFQVEYRELYQKWLRMGLIRVAPTDQTFTNLASTTVANCAAILGVAENMGTSTPYRLLTPAQSVYGASPFWGAVPGNKASNWAATGAADNLLVTIDPPDVNGTYFVRYVSTVPYQTNLTDQVSGQPTSVDLPYGGDERLVLGACVRAHLKDSGGQRSLMELRNEADAALAFQSWGRIAGDSPRVRRVNSTVRPAHWRPGTFPSDPRYWTYV
jgi:hypothetical protein